MPDPAARERLRRDLHRARSELEQALRDGDADVIRRRKQAVRILARRWNWLFATGIGRDYQGMPDVIGHED